VKRREFITLFGGAMEGTMMRFMLLLFVALLCGTGRLAAQQTVGNLEQYSLSAISALAERAVAAFVPR